MQMSVPFRNNWKVTGKRGFLQFKVKPSGRYEHDRDRLALFSGECAEDRDVRLDANNLWQDWRVAADYLQRLPGSFTGIEEPLAADDRGGMASLFRETGIPVILDESLLRAGQVAGLADGIGWRINLRVSKLGGLLRSLDVLEAARDRGIPVIVCVQVGETSQLTRAALTLATAAGDLLAGQEGAFGAHLLSREICRPVLMFGPGGRLGGELVEKLAGMPGYVLVRAGDTDAQFSKEP
jgi:L-alanine-DL-glutamate epimerase-like enolase superfamily enzyme